MSPVTAAAPPHVALHLLHAGTRLQRDAAGVEDHALADKATGLSLALPPFQLSTTSREGRTEPWPNTEQRTHLEFSIALDIEDLDLDTEFGQRCGTGGKFHRTEHVRRLVDQFARQDHAAASPETLLQALRASVAAMGDDGHLDRLVRAGFGSSSFLPLVL